MKKLLSLVLALAVMLCCVSVFAEEAQEVELPELYKSDFTVDENGWFANNCAIAVADGALVITGRSAGWQSANLNCPLKGNTEYKFSVAIYQDALDSANFKISAAQNGANWISTESAPVPKGEWTTIEGVLTTGDFTAFTLYVETDDDPEFNKIDFQIKDFTICGPADGIAAE